MSIVQARPDQEDDAVVAGELRYWSPSQVKAFDPAGYGGCHRKWWFDKVAHVPRVEMFAQTLGKRVHESVDHYLTTGEDVLLAPARPARHLLPAPKSLILVEHSIDGAQLADGIPPVKGRIDVVDLNPVHVAADGGPLHEPHVVEIIDHKSTSSMDYAKRGHELMTDPQMVTYARWATVSLKFGAVRVSHVVMTTRGRAVAEKRTALMDSRHVDAAFAGVVATINQMRSVAKIPRVEGVQPNWDSCAAYKGCAYAGVCPRPKEVALRAIFGGKTMGLLDRLNSQKAPSAVAPNGAPAAPPPPASTAGHMHATAPAKPARTLAEIQAERDRLQADIDAEENRLRAAERAAQAGTLQQDLGFCSACGSQLTGANGSRLPDGRVVHVGCPRLSAPAPSVAPAVGQVTPPDAPASGQNAPAAQAIPPEVLAALTPEQRAHVEAAQRAMGVAPPATPAPAPAAEKPKTARKPKGSPAAQARAGTPTAQGFVPGPGDAEMQAAVDAASASSPPTGTSSPPTGTPAADGEGLAIYVDAIVERGGITALRSLRPYVDELCAALCEEYKCVDVRAAADDTPLAFGKWKGALSALAAANPPPNGAYSVVGASEVEQVVVDALRPKCAVFVRGVR